MVTNVLRNEHILIPDADLVSIINRTSAVHDGGVVMVRVRPKNDPEAIAQGLQDDLQALLNLQMRRQAVQDVVQSYNARCDLLKQSAMPPAEEADRLMRYHTALDRQLSKCIGELLQMSVMQPQPPDFANHVHGDHLCSFLLKNSARQ